MRDQNSSDRAGHLIGHPIGSVSRRTFIGATGGMAAATVMPGCTTSQADRSELYYQSISQVAALLRSGELSPVELTRIMLERIDAIDGKLKAFATITPELALAAARKAEDEIRSGIYRGILHGIPVAYKDLFYTKGVRTMGGLAINRDFVPDYDATVVARLADAGVVPLGKLNMTEGAFVTYAPGFDIPINPWNESYWTGVSSSGSGVAVAAGLCFAALGSDTAGSIRWPAMANGVVGLKPTYGRVSRYGVMTMSESLDHVGPFARSVEDAAAMLQAIAGQDENDSTALALPSTDFSDAVSGDIRGMKIGFDPNYGIDEFGSGLAEAILVAVAQMEALGAEIVEVNLGANHELIEETLDALGREVYQSHAQSFPSRANEYGEMFAGFLAGAQSISDETYAKGVEQRRMLNLAFEGELAKADVVVAPTGVSFPVTQDQLRGAAPVVGDYLSQTPLWATVPANFAGTPSLTLPCGMSPEGIPYGMQLLGQRVSEASLIKAGHAYETSTDWHRLHPAI